LNVYDTFSIGKMVQQNTIYCTIFNSLFRSRNFSLNKKLNYLTNLLNPCEIRSREIERIGYFNVAEINAFTPEMKWI